ncbi:MAG TPA: HD domain-containing protein [Streptosporangiaceae bacterium]|nr:HD domain-containing protein [Streptosporangiaceae bacterium]
MNTTSAWAREIARELLEQPLPRRWAHTQGVARKARALAPILGDNADLLEAAAWLHDIGYSPEIAATGFHPLDGARYLRDIAHADDIICRLVAGHSCAIIEAGERGLADTLSREFPPADEALSDALTYCDMTTTPDGEPVTVGRRLSEISERYGPGHLVTRFIHLAEPYLVDAVRSIQRKTGLCLTIAHAMNQALNSSHP